MLDKLVVNEINSIVSSQVELNGIIILSKINVFKSISIDLNKKLGSFPRVTKKLIES